MLHTWKTTFDNSPSRASDPLITATLQLPHDEAFIGHRVISGKTGSGKTNFVLNEMMDVIYRGTHWLTFIAPHEKAAIDLAAELYSQFSDSILPRLVIERLVDTDKVIFREIIQKSDSEDEWQRQQENDAFAENMISLMAARRKKTDFYENPSLQEISQLAIACYQNQDVWWPEYLLSQVLDPKTAISKFALQHCMDEEVRDRLIQKINVPPSVAETSTRAVARMLDLQLGNTAIRARTSGPQIFDKRAFHNNCGIFVIVANGCSMDALRTYVSIEFQQTVAWMKNGEIGPGVFVVDEVANYQLAGMFEARAFNTMRGSGLNIWHIVQSPDYQNDDVTEAILDNSDHFVFQQGSAKSAKYFAEDLLETLDEYKVHHTTVQQVHDGYDFIDRRTSSSSMRITDDGAQTTHGESFGQAPIAKYRQESIPSYQAGNEQVLWLTRKIQSLPRGRYFYKTSRGGAGSAKAKLFRNSWAFPGLKEAKYLECLQKIKTSAIYQQPIRTPFQPPMANPPPTHMAKKGRTK